jgi:hypothetical protein
VFGYSQIYLRNYSDSFAPTVLIHIVFLAFYLVAHLKYHVNMLDVTAAFLMIMIASHIYLRAYSQVGNHVCVSAYSLMTGAGSPLKNDTFGGTQKSTPKIEIEICNF